MKKIVQTLLIAGTAIFATSCEDVVQIKLDEGSQLYVIDAFVNDLPGTQTIRVTTNDSYFSNRVAPPVADANVVLRDITVGKNFNFTYKGDGNYTFSVDPGNPISVIDHQYELHVTIAGFDYNAMVTQKRPASIDSISAMLLDGSNGFQTPDTVPTYMCNLYAKDKTDNKTDYYWIKTFRNDTLLFGPSDINICIDGTGGPVTGIEVDSTDFTPPATFLGFNLFHKDNTCKVEIHSITEDTYNFFLQASAQINNGGLFATTPENVKTNIRTPSDAKTKAVGWFNMASTTSKKIKIK